MVGLTPRQFALVSNFTSKFLFTFISGIILCKYSHCWIFPGLAISSDTTGRSFLENILGNTILSMFFANHSEPSYVNDECLQSPFKVSTVTVVFMPSTFNSSSRFVSTEFP